MKAGQQNHSPVSHQPETGGKNARMVLSDNRSESLAQAKMLQVIQRVDNGGAYSDTRKSDAHHMPSARAIAAIIAGNQQKNLHAANPATPTMPAAPDMSMDVSAYTTLAVNDIYKGAPAVWMPPDDHKQTRTYGGRSSTALSQDLPTIYANTPDVAFQTIQNQDIADCQWKTANTDTITGLGMIGGASAATVERINDAIEEGAEVMASNADSRTMVPLADVIDALRQVYEWCDGNAARIYRKMVELMGKEIAPSHRTIVRVLSSGVNDVQKNTADAIRYTFEHFE